MEESISDFGLTATIQKQEAEFKEQMIIIDCSDSIQELIIAEQSFLAELKKTSKQIAESIANIDNPNSISEERKQNLFRSHQKWGKLGWTWLPNETLTFYDEPPIDANHAYEKVKLHCSSRSMEWLFGDLRKMDIRKTDLDSAIFCYRNQQYKACSLVLFGIIESNLIRKIPKPQERGRRRPVGGSAVKTLKEREEANGRWLSMMLHGANLFSCLEVFFANGNDFRDEPPIINRNFVGHGMNKREVRQRDCVQLFLALYNLMFFMRRCKTRK